MAASKDFAVNQYTRSQVNNYISIKFGQQDCCHVWLSFLVCVCVVLCCLIVVIINFDNGALVCRTSFSFLPVKFKFSSQYQS